MIILHRSVYLLGYNYHGTVALSPVVLGIVVLYIGILLAIGLYASRMVETGEDFMLAGRRLGPIFVAATLAATEVGGGSSMGVAQQGFGEWGLSSAWYVITMAIAFVALAFIAPKLRSTLSTTVPEFFKKRYGKSNHILTVIVLTLPMIGLTAVQIMASGIVLSILVGIPYFYATLIMGIIAVSYSFIGGLWSVTFTDMLQWIFVIGGIILTVPFALNVVGDGVIGGWQTMQNTLEPWRFDLTEGIGIGQIISLTVVYFTSFSVGQEYVQRYFAAEDNRAAKLGSLGAAASYILFAFFPAILGLAALTFQEQGQTIPFVAEYGTRYVLPGFAAVAAPDILLGILFGALVSATMSSADSDLVAASTMVVNDIYEPYVNPEASSKHLGRVSKIATGFIGLIAILVALFEIGIIVDVLLFSFTFRAAGIFFPYIASHYWDGANKYSSMLAIISGSAVVGAEALGMVTFGFLQEPVIPALAVSLLFFVVGSYVISAPEEPTMAELKQT